MRTAMSRGQWQPRTFIRTQQHAIAVGSMNEIKPCLKDPLLPRCVQSTPLKRGFTVMRMRAVTASGINSKKTSTANPKESVYKFAYPSLYVSKVRSAIS